MTLTLEVTMKMVKSLLLSGAAGMVAVAGAQAADLPVKAKPVEYVKVCSLYGEGFFYIPGTDTCLKIGGFVRFDTYFNGAQGSGAAAINTTVGLNDRVDTHDVGFRARTTASFDARTQTEYGTLRSYARFGFQATSIGGAAATVVYTERAFIQFAGFTFGNTQSYFDFLAHSYAYSSFQFLGGADTGGGGTLLAAYTAQFGNGLSATISIEDANQNKNLLVDATTVPGSCAAAGVGCVLPVGAGTSDYAAQQVPDIVANFRVDQAWGSAQVMGALHQIRAGCIGTNGIGVGCVAPGDEWGFAVGGGVIINLPWNKGDVFFLEGTYTEGALRYIGAAPNGPLAYARFDGATVASVWNVDGAFNAVSGIEKATGWDIYGGIEHYWTPSLRTSVWGTYSQVEYGGALSSLISTASGTAQGLDHSYNIWAVGTRTVWQPVKNLDLGFEVLYGRIEPKAAGGTLQFAGSGGRPSGLYTIADQEIWSGMIRVQRNFWP
jgi:hypothetical protein